MAEENQVSESERTLSKLLAKKDQDAMAVAADLLTENAQLRADKRELTGRVTQLAEAAPKEGSVVLAKADAERYAAYAALGKPDDLKAALDQAARDRAAVVTQGNREALAALGLKAAAARLPEFAGVVVTARRDGDEVVGTVKEGETETRWGDWVKAKGLEADLKDFGLEPTSPPPVPALGQVGGAPTTGDADPVDALNKQMFGGKK